MPQLVLFLDVSSIYLLLTSPVGIPLIRHLELCGTFALVGVSLCSGPFSFDSREN